MSKNLSLDIKTIYQVGLTLVGIMSGLLISLNIYYVFQIFKTEPDLPSLKIREQQLKNAIQLVEQKTSEN